MYTFSFSGNPAAGEGVVGVGWDISAKDSVCEDVDAEGAMVDDEVIVDDEDASCTCPCPCCCACDEGADPISPRASDPGGEGGKKLWLS